MSDLTVKSNSSRFHADLTAFDVVEMNDVLSDIPDKGHIKFIVLMNM